MLILFVIVSCFQSTLIKRILFTVLNEICISSIKNCNNSIFYLHSSFIFINKRQRKINIELFTLSVLVIIVKNLKAQILSDFIDCTKCKINLSVFKYHVKVLHHFLRRNFYSVCSVPRMWYFVVQIPEHFYMIHIIQFLHYLLPYTHL